MKKKLQKVSLLVSGLALAATLTAFFSVSFAWFTHKRDAAIDKPETEMTAHYQVNYLTYLDGSATAHNGDIFYTDLIPGQNRKTIKLVITNIGELATNVNLAFLAPTLAQETPFIDTDGDYGNEGYYYYFGSQIKIENTLVTVNGTAVSGLTPISEFLVTTEAALVKGQVNGVEEAVDPIPELEILEDVYLEVGDVLTVEYTLLFVDNATNQNVYMEAWPTVGASSRTFKIHLGEATP